jgi:hypothetical protein
MDAAMESAKASAKEVQGKLRAKFDKVPVLQQAEVRAPSSVLFCVLLLIDGIPTVVAV